MWIFTLEHTPFTDILFIRIKFSFSDLSDVSDMMETLHRIIDCLPDLNHCVFERLIFNLARYCTFDLSFFSLSFFSPSPFSSSFLYTYTHCLSDLFKILLVLL